MGKAEKRSFLKKISGTGANANTAAFISWIAVIIWMAVIFYLSSQDSYQSGKISTGITEFIIETVERVIPDAEIDAEKFHLAVRKSAHFFAYLVLGLLTSNALDRNRAPGPKIVKIPAIALLICVLYAFTDEAHQTAVPGRAGQITDVLIDSIGSAVGIILFPAVKKRVNAGRAPHRRR